jgi:hypothetical protein
VQGLPGGRWTPTAAGSGFEGDLCIGGVLSHHAQDIMAIAAHEDLELQQFDVRTAFLNGWLKEEVYLRVPAGLEEKLGKGGKVLRRRSAIYGLRQASRVWNERPEGELSRRGFVQSNVNPSLWIVHGKDGVVLSLFYVDDGLVAARTSQEPDAMVYLVESAGRAPMRGLAWPSAEVV